MRTFHLAVTHGHMLSDSDTSCRGKLRRPPDFSTRAPSLVYMEWMELLSLFGVVGGVLAAFFGHLSLSSPLNRLVKLAGTLESLESFDQESFENVRSAVQNLSRKVSKKEKPWEETSRMLLLSVFFYLAAAITATFVPVFIDPAKHLVEMILAIVVGVVFLVLGLSCFVWAAVHQFADLMGSVRASRKRKKSGRASKEASQTNETMSDSLGSNLT